MTLLVTSILCDDLPAAVEAAGAAMTAGTDAVELRIDRWSEASSCKAVAEMLPPWRWIVTCRPTSEGGYFEGDTTQRVARLMAAASCGECYVDFEFAGLREKGDARQQLGQPRHRLMLSSHDFSGRPADPAGLLAAMAAEPNVAAVKLAWQARDIRDNFVALELLRTAGVPTTVICMGEAGLLSRVLARKFGAFATYCAPFTGKETAPGQVTLAEMLGRYRWRSIGPATRVYGVVGAPVAHSMSPTLFNALFARHGLDAVYLPLLVGSEPGVLDGFLRGCLERCWLDVGGFSVTVPHKSAAARWVGDRIEPLAARIGAVNTLVAAGDGFTGHNTDYAGAIESIAAGLNCERGELCDLRVEILGAGGVARALVAGLGDCGAQVTIYNRTRPRADALAEEFACRSEAWERRGESDDVDLLINCTSVGMWPEVDESPMPADRLDGDLTVFDTVYNPVQTRLLRESKQAGCRTIDGLSMFVNQAAAQFELWTGRAADRVFMRELVEAELSGVTEP